MSAQRKYSIEELQIQGNLVSNNWFKYLKRDNGRTYYLAIHLLAEIVYWYRPTQREDKDGNIIKSNKFSGDKLQLSYRDLMVKLDESKHNLQRAMKYLIEKGFISQELRTITLKNGRKLHNVMFIDLNIHKILDITNDNIQQPSNDLKLVPHKSVQYQQKSSNPSNKPVGTYTKIKNTNNNIKDDKSSSDTFVLSVNNLIKKYGIDEFNKARSIALKKGYQDSLKYIHGILKNRLQEGSRELDRRNDQEEQGGDLEVENKAVSRCLDEPTQHDLESWNNIKQELKEHPKWGLFKYLKLIGVNNKQLYLSTGNRQNDQYFIPLLAQADFPLQVTI